MATLTRTADEIELESVNHELAKFYSKYSGFQEEIQQYKTTQDYLETVAGQDDAGATHLLLTLAKDQYRLVTGREWAGAL